MSNAYDLTSPNFCRDFEELARRPTNCGNIMFTKTQGVAPPKMEVGMVDPHIKETVTYVAELDVEAFRLQSRKTLHFLLLMLPLGICIPCVWIMICLLYLSTKKYTEATIRGTQVYLTENTLVCTVGNQPIEYSRVTIPLANIASVMVQSGVITVNIKPTASQVLLNAPIVSRDSSTHATLTTVATRSVPIYNVKNAEEFAKVIQSYLH